MSHALQSSEAALPPPYFESDDRRFRLYQGDCLQLMPRMPEAAFDLIFADPPYFLSNGGITCHAGKMVSVHKGKWDESKGAEADHEFTLRWLAECRRVNFAPLEPATNPTAVALAKAEAAGDA